MDMGTRVDSSSILVMIPEEIEEMLREARLHPELAGKLSCPLSVKSFEDGIAIIAAYCDVAMHGEYTGADLKRLAVILWQKLKAKRGSVIINS